jgi:FKBP-type peptidyl-prolyl cis-trans isomerase (trigger factor)
MILLSFLILHSSSCTLLFMSENNQKAKSYASASIKKLDKSRVEITGSIASSEWERFRGQALKNLNDSVTIDGFRKGNVPENVLISKIGEKVLLEEMAELALSKAYIEILIENKIDAIGKPQVQVTKLALGNPLEFVATTAVVPEVRLPDYKKIAKDEIANSPKNEHEVTDKDVDEAILRVRKSHAPHEGHDHEKMSPEEHEKAIMESLPEFNDEFVRKLGSEFADVEDFKKKIRVMIGENKKDEAREKLRIRIANAISDKAEVELPEIMVETELNRTQAQFESDIERMGVKLDDYLKHAKKTLEDIRKEWLPHAEKKAKLQLILNAIAIAEKIEPSKQEVEKEVDHIVEHYKEADRERASVYATTVLTNEKVFQFLEGKSV